MRALQAREGYPVDRGLEEMLDALQLRLTCGAFPHEIGLFLGYPPEDVEGFRLHRGRDYKLCGCWKVYSDVEGARQCFRRSDRCRAALCRRVRAGGSLPQMFRAAWPGRWTVSAGGMMYVTALWAFADGSHPGDPRL